MGAGLGSARAKSIAVYLLIVIFFSLLSWGVWMYFNSKIKEARSGKAYSSVKIRHTNNRTSS
jgi:hypothetical protein